MAFLNKWLIIILIAALLGVGLVFGTPGAATANWGLLITCLLFGFWFILVRRLDKQYIDPRTIALLATMAALATLARVAFAPIAGFKPTTFIVLITGYVCGSSLGFGAGALCGLASNFFLGQGPWTPWQMACWGLCGLAAGWLGRGKKDLHMASFLVLSGLCGILFGWIMNIWHWVAFIEPLNIKTFIATYIASLPFDGLHAAGNIVFALLLGKPFYKILYRVFNRIKPNRLSC